MTAKQQNQQQKKRNKDRGRQIEVAKVVTPERASEIGNVIGKIAASTVAAHEAAGEPSLIVLNPAPAKVTAEPQNTEKLLESVLEALPEPKAPGQGRRKSRRVTTGGNITPGQESNNQ